MRDFHRALCEVRVLDPACGSGNFLYVTMEHMKRLEGEVLQMLEDMGDRELHLELQGRSVDPHQFLAIELNPRAAAIAEVVLWIGHLQWHFRTRGKAATVPEPVLKKYDNIECRDAVLKWDAREIVRDQHGAPVTRWDGHTTKSYPVTGLPVPDESARMELYKYKNPRPATWPQADFVVGNPPFIGAGPMREALGSGYTEALRGSYPKIGESSDFVMYWWDHAARLTRAGKLRRFGLITTNSIRQNFNRLVLEAHLGESKQPLSIVFAIPDHPWVDSGDGADVRLSMTVGAAGRRDGVLATVVRESKTDQPEREVVLAGGGRFTSI